ncbi:MAG: response regulator transcription factor [Verrucomicrobiae bacterium]|nr:response regulator transcription factor [Verrucomicrobiae bacterium]
MSGLPEVRLALIEDDPRLRARLVALLHARPGWKVVAECASAANAASRIAAARPDLVLSDILLRGSSGIDAIAPIKRALPRVRVVMLTVIERPADIVRAIDQGACGYILKKDLANLTQHVEDVLAGRAPFMSPSVARRLLEQVRRQTRGRPPGAADILSAREREVLEHAGRGLHHKEIGRVLGITASTVKTHLQRTFDKLGTHSTIESIHKLRGDDEPLP